MTGNSAPWRPSNGTGGDIFYDEWCANCERERYPESKPCTILARAFAFGLDESGYPKEWVCDDDGPRCTAFVKRGNVPPSTGRARIRDKRQVEIPL